MLVFGLSFPAQKKCLNFDLFQIPRLCELRPYLSRNYTREEFIQLEFVS
jgi:hypothetical protein